LTGSQANSDFLVPACDLSALFPEPAINWIRQHGGKVKMQHRIRSIKPGNESWTTSWDTGESHHDAIIVATSPVQASSLLRQLPDCGFPADQIDALSYQPIVTVYAEFPAMLTLRTPLIGWVDPVPLFIFDLDATHHHKGLVAAVASAEGLHLQWDDNRWLDEIHTRLEQAVGPLPAPRLIKRITEKRATFSCGPDVIRPSHITPCKRLYLAGDYIEGPYPATLEGAIRSGVQCAQLVIQQS
jgi:predicted NAD/FAD-dependent oxidoreductase